MQRLLKVFYCSVVLLFTSAQVVADSKYRVVLQISDGNPAKQTLVLNVADNLRRQFDDKLELEIVAFGPGLNLMTTGNNQAQRLRKLNSQGVKLVACKNTFNRMSKLGGKAIKLHPGVDISTDGGGAAHIVRLVQQGYVLIKP